MTTTFTKGQRVHYVSIWDNAGTAQVRTCIVAACGKTQLALVDAGNGSPIGRSLRLGYINDDKNPRGVFVVAGLTDEQAERFAHAVAVSKLAADVAFYERRLATDPKDAWAIERLPLARAEKPAVIWPFAPGGKYHDPKPYVAAARATKYVARVDGVIVGQRKTENRTYTHAVVGVTRDGKLKAVAWCGRLDLAQKQLTDRYAMYKASDLRIVPAEKA